MQTVISTSGPEPSRVGVHAPIKSTLSYVDKVGASAVQIYVGNSRGWARPLGNPVQDEEFAVGCRERDIPAFIHASLLVNIGSPTAETVEQSRETLMHALVRASQMGVSGVVFHAGSSVEISYRPRALEQVREVLLPLLDALPADGPKLLVEPSAGGGRSLVSKISDLGTYLAAVDHHPNLGICFDTCHAWAAGHDLVAPGGMKLVLDELMSVGTFLGLVHANDSRDGCGSLRDRHENVGKGTIGPEPFMEMMSHPALIGVPVIVETPEARHAEDIALLRGLR